MKRKTEQTDSKFPEIRSKEELWLFSRGFIPRYPCQAHDHFTEWIMVDRNKLVDADHHEVITVQKGFDKWTACLGGLALKNSSQAYWLKSRAFKHPASALEDLIKRLNKEEKCTATIV